MGKPNVLSWRADHGTGADDNSNIMLSTPKLFVVHALEGLEFASPELNILCDICKGIKSPVEELIAKAAAQSGNPPLDPCILENGPTEMDSYISMVTSMYPQILISLATLFPCAMTQRWPGMLGGSKPWNWCPVITGGPTCHSTLASMCRPATYAFG
jgi:hypothetical protein